MKFRNLRPFNISSGRNDSSQMDAPATSVTLISSVSSGTECIASEKSICQITEVPRTSRKGRPRPGLLTRSPMCRIFTATNESHGPRQKAIQLSLKSARPFVKITLKSRPGSFHIQRDSRSLSADLIVFCKEAHH